MLILTPTEVSGVVHVAVERHTDKRGYFAQTFCAREFEAAGIRPVVTQATTQFNFWAGTTLRGASLSAGPGS